MKITVIGKQHLEGTSKKTGKPFSANVVHYLSRARGLEGHRGDSSWLDPEVFPLSTIEVGKEYVLDCDSRGYVQDFFPAPPAPKA